MNNKLVIDHATLYKETLRKIDSFLIANLFNLGTFIY